VEELRKAEEDLESYTTAEVLAQLEGLRCVPSGGNE
jgi:hypothetical protein